MSYVDSEQQFVNHTRLLSHVGIHNTTLGAVEDGDSFNRIS